MKKILKLTLMLLFPVLCWSQQPGFKKLYTGDVTGLSFVDLLWDGEKLIATGQFLTDTAPNNALNGLLYMELDTNGNTLLTDIYFYPNDAITSNINNSITRISDGHIYVMSQILYDTAGLLAIYKNSERIKAIKIPVNGLNAWLYHCVALENSLLLSGRFSNHQYNSEGLLMKVDTMGNEIWRKNYGVNGLWCGIEEPYILNNNTFLLPGYKSYLPITGPIINRWTRSRILTVDSLGNIKAAWESEKNVESGIATRLQHLPNGNWLYATAAFVPMPGQIDDFGSRPKLVCRDSNFNLVWERYLSDFDDKSTSILDITPTADGNYLVIGRWTWYNTTAIHKFSPEGDSIWTFYDTCEPALNCGNLLEGIVTLSGGSIFAAGSTENYETNKASGVLIKLNKNGCIDPLCGVMIGSYETELAGKIKIYPNPASGIITITDPIGEQIDLFDVTGRKISSTTVTSKSQVIDIHLLPSGVYLLRMQEKTLHVTYRIINQ